MKDEENKRYWKKQYFSSDRGSKAWTTRHRGAEPHPIRTPHCCHHVNTLQVLTNFEIGRRIVEHEQKGAERAEYGKELLKELSARLKEEFGRGFSEDNLARMRNFYLAWKDRVIEFPRRFRGNSEAICQNAFC